MLIGGIVDRVVGNGWSDSARNDALQRTGTGNAAKLKVLEQKAGSIVEAVMLVRVSPYVRPKRVNESFLTG